MAARQRIARLSDETIPLREQIVARTQEQVNYMLVGVFDLIRAKQDEYDAYQLYLEAIRDYWLARIDLCARGRRPSAGRSARFARRCAGGSGGCFEYVGPPPRRTMMKMVGRRSVLGALSALTAMPLFGSARAAAAPSDAADRTAPRATGPRRRAAGHRPVVTPNGRSLPWKLVGGAKEFHLVAEEFEHEFAPGCVAKCWGYNGSTPGPTIEAVEGDRVRILVTNRLKEPTTIHWHGLILPNGMDGVGGLNQPDIQPGETYAYEFTLKQAGTHMYHPHADEMVQMAFGMMGFFIIHPKDGEPEPVDRDFAIMLHNWALHPGTYRPDPAVMLDFNLWTFNSKVFPATAPLVVRLNERVRFRIGNLSMYNHPIHIHGHRFWVTGSDGDRWPKSAWRSEVTEIVGVGQMRDFEFVADNPGDWAFHCHMSHHTMNAMGHTRAQHDRRRSERRRRTDPLDVAGLYGDGRNRHVRARRDGHAGTREHVADDDGHRTPTSPTTSTRTTTRPRSRTSSRSPRVSTR